MFQNKQFIGASGKKLEWKVECDEFTPEMWDWAADRIIEQWPTLHIYGGVSPPGRVIGVPTGGEPLAISIEPFCDPDSDWTLVVDDVWTTGGSMIRTLKENDLWDVTRPKENVYCFVVFCRQRRLPSSWASALWYWGGK